MSTLVERLRGVVGSGGPRFRPPKERGEQSERQRSGTTVLARARGVDDLAEVFGGDWRGSQGHRYLVVDRQYLPGYRHGRLVMAESVPPAGGTWPRLHLLTGRAAEGDAWAPRATERRLLFVDLETTGLAGGAGTYAFLVGCGWFEGGVFRTRQFFLSSFASERVLLDEVAALARATDVLVTFNGKTFDLPLIETRFLLHRMEKPFAGRPHVDMLHHARRLWRVSHDESLDGPSGCRLTTLEEWLCGHLREGDVPGFEIPARYFQYVRDGDARPLEAVLEHNRLDLVTLAFITARAAQLLEDGPAGATTAREALGLGRLYERGGMMAEAGACYERAGLTTDILTRAEALRAYAILRRREGQHEQAAVAWREILELRRCPSALAREASEALAVHHEHRSRNLGVAKRFAIQALQFDAGGSRQQAVQHRLSRLDRKLGRTPSDPVELF